MGGRFKVLRKNKFVIRILCLAKQWHKCLKNGEKVFGVHLKTQKLSRPHSPLMKKKKTSKRCAWAMKKEEPQEEGTGGDRKALSVTDWRPVPHVDMLKF